MLHMDGMDMVQTVAILSIISAKYALCNPDHSCSYLSKNLAPKEAVTVDMMVEGWNDFLNEAYQFIYSAQGHAPSVLGEWSQEEPHQSGELLQAHWRMKLQWLDDA